MYNRYIPNGTAYTRITEAEPAPSPPPRQKQSRRTASSTGLLSTLLKHLKLEELDTGDVLLLLILLLLFLDGEDNMELLIALGLILLLGLEQD